jgi:hypothetical protein
VPQFVFGTCRGSGQGPRHLARWIALCLRLRARVVVLAVACPPIRACAFLRQGFVAESWRSAAAYAVKTAVWIRTYSVEQRSWRSAASCRHAYSSVMHVLVGCMPCPCMHDVYGRPSYIIDSTKYLSSITVLYVLLLYQDRSPQRVRVAYMYLLGFHAKKRCVTYFYTIG